MATLKIKATYSIDAETTALLDKLAQRWAVSKSDIRLATSNPADFRALATHGLTLAT